MSFFLAFVLTFILRGFGGKANISQVLRMSGFTQLFTIVGAVLHIILIIAGLDTPIFLIFSLIGLIAFIIGLTTFTSLNEVSVIISLIIASIITLILVLITALLIFIAILSSILSSFSAT